MDKYNTVVYTVSDFSRHYSIWRRHKFNVISKGWGLVLRLESLQLTLRFVTELGLVFSYGVSIRLWIPCDGICL